MSRGALDSLAELVSVRRADIVARFVTQLERQRSRAAGGLDDRLPSLLDALERTLHSGTVPLEADGANKPAGDLRALMTDLQLLRRAITSVAAEASLAISIRELELLSAYFEAELSRMAVAYERERDAERQAQRSALTLLAEAGQLLASAPDARAIGGRLSALLVPRFADWCAVQLAKGSLEEMPIAHVEPERVWQVRELYRGLAGGSELPYGQLLRDGEPLLIERVDETLLRALARTEQQLSLLQAVGTCSLAIVPLAWSGRVFGAMTVAYSTSGRHYERADLLLLEELGRRVALALQHAEPEKAGRDARSQGANKEEFVALVSHELRTPLHAILGWTRLLRTSSVPEEKRDHALEVIERNANAQAQVISDLLDLSHVVTGRLRITVGRVDLAAVVQMAIQCVRPLAEAKQVELETPRELGELPLQGDAERLQQVVWNLLSNAVKYTGPGGRVRVQADRIEDDYEVIVEDDGQGITEEFLPDVFDSFHQSEGHATRRHGGLGVGLSIVKHIVELHGGTVTAHSDGEQRGSRFRVILPINFALPEAAHKTHTRKVEPRMPESRPRLEGMTALVVDDEADARELVAYVLERSGMSVRVAESASEALSLIAQHAHDVLISDIGMPEEDGYSLIARIRALPDAEKRSIPAIALTAFSSAQDRARALEVGFQAHMTKPLEPSQLVATIVELVPVRAESEPA